MFWQCISCCQLDHASRVSLDSWPDVLLLLNMYDALTRTSVFFGLCAARTSPLTMHGSIGMSARNNRSSYDVLSHFVNNNLNKASPPQKKKQEEGCVLCVERNEKQLLSVVRKLKKDFMMIH